MNRKILLWSAAISLCAVVILMNLVPFVYGIVDDRSMMEIISGQYLGHPDAHIIFTGYWYPLLISALYRLTSRVDWYAYGYIFLQAACMWMILYRTAANSEARSEKVWNGTAAVLFCLLLGLRMVTQITFTTTAAVLGATVIFLYATVSEINYKNLLLLFVFCFLTVELRFAVFCMVMPVCGILWLFRISRKGKRTRTEMMLPLAAAGALLLYLAGLGIGYGNAAWSHYSLYNNVRSLIYDYDDYMFPRYEDETELYNSLGIYDKSRAKNLYYYNYTADEEIDQNFFEEYLQVRIAVNRERNNPLRRLADSIWEYAKNTLKGKYGWAHLFALAGYIFLIILYGAQKRWRSFFKILCILSVQLLLWIYLIYRGRMPQRVLLSLNLMLIVAALILWMEALQALGWENKRKRLVRAVFLAVLCGLVVYNLWDVRRENLERAKWNQSVEELKEYCMAHPGNFYFNDVTSMAFTTYNVYLWRQEPYNMNYMSLGDWISFSPLWEEKLAQNGIGSVKDALYSQDNVYLICSFDRGLEYLASMYENVEYTEVDRVAGFGIYKLKMEGN